MQNDKEKFIKFLVVGLIILIIMTNGAIIVPAIIGLTIYFFLVRQKNVEIIKPNIKNMNNFDIEAFRKKFTRASSVVVILVLGVVLLANMVVIIPAGETGVYHLFGKVRDKEVSSGIHLINPLASIRRMSIRTEQYTMSIATMEGQKMGDDSIDALTKEGLKVQLDITVLYHLKEDKASDVYRDIGMNYEEKVLRPEVRSAIREIIALYEAKDIYSDKREEAVQKIEDLLKENVNPRGIEVESVLMRNVALPVMLTNAIEDKLSAEQEAQKYDFVLQREEKEAERKRIEAAGQRDAQSIINQSLTSRYLQYLYIQNLENREGTVYVPYDLPLLRGI